MMRQLLITMGAMLLLLTPLHAQQDGERGRFRSSVEYEPISIVGTRPIREIGYQQTKFDSLALKEGVSLSMADVLAFNSSI